MSSSSNQPKITSLSDREHILKRSGIYFGGKNIATDRSLHLVNDKFIYTSIPYVPGLIKIIYEVIDNAIDVAIKTNFEYANKIEIEVSETKVSVKDNGYGISQSIDEKTGLSSVILAVGSARAGSNFDDSQERYHLGVNGLGVYLTNVFSKYFVCDTCNGDNRFRVEFKNNAESYTVTSNKCKNRSGTIVEFEPDLERFKLEKIDENHINIIKERLLILSLTYPEVSIKFNGSLINLKNPKQFISMFGEVFETINFDNGLIAYFPSITEEFMHFTIINGQILKNGGSHVEFMNNKVVNYLRDKFSRKFKDIKPSDIRNKLLVVSLFRNFPNPEYSSQTKEELTNSTGELSKYLGSVDFDSFAHKIYKNQDISDPIVDLYRLKEDYKNRKELQKIGKKPTKIKSDKYWPPIGSKDYIMICEGDSARSGILGELGREGKGYFAIRGKMLNVLEAKLSRISDNEEIDTLIKILETDIQTKKFNTGIKYYEVSEINNPEDICIIAETDLLKVGEDWIPFTSLSSIKYAIKNIDANKIDPVFYYAQPTVNQPFDSSYKYVVAATDNDLDGLHIRALILTLFNTLLLPILKANKVKYLQTPLIALKKGEEIVKYFFDFEDYRKYIEENPKVKGDWKYYKGLGSWAKGEFKALVDKEGIDNFIKSYKYDSDAHDILVNWMSKNTAEYRKVLIQSTQIDVKDA